MERGLVGHTLAIYLSRKFLSAILGLFALAAILIFLFDVLELLRRSSGQDGATLARIGLISILRVPQLMEQVLPFAVLFGAIAAFLALSRKLELVVARAAGVSVWQFTAPAILVGLGLGIAAVTLYNPLAVILREQSDEIASGLFSSEQNFLLQTTGEIWLRQDGTDGESVLHAKQTMDGGTRLLGITLFTFDRSARFSERVEAREALLEDKRWRLSDATVYSTTGDPSAYATYYVSTYLTPTEVRESIAAPESIGFWDLPRVIELSQRAGLPAYRYSLQYQTLLARPALLAAMILIAACVSLRVSRMGGVGRLILGGILAGFVLYVLSELGKDLGGAGIVPPVVAAWAPGVFGVLMGFTILLHLEDG